MLPDESTATPWGWSKFAWVAGKPSPQPLVGPSQIMPVPATVEIVPAAVTSRIRWSKASAMKRMLEASTVKAWGADIYAEDAGPPSPHADVEGVQVLPVPTTVLMIPLGVTTRMRLRSAM